MNHSITAACNGGGGGEDKKLESTIENAVLVLLGCHVGNAWGGHLQYIQGRADS